jgi:hypothetical protein
MHELGRLWYASVHLSVDTLMYLRCYSASSLVPPWLHSRLMPLRLSYHVGYYSDPAFVERHCYCSSSNCTKQALVGIVAHRFLCCWRRLADRIAYIYSSDNSGQQQNTGCRLVDEENKPVRLHDHEQVRRYLDCTWNGASTLFVKPSFRFTIQT